MLAEAEVHPQQEERARNPALLRRGVRRQGKRLPGNLPLLEGPAEAEDVGVEPPFAEAKDWHGLRRFGLRGLEKKVNAPRRFGSPQHKTLGDWSPCWGAVTEISGTGWRRPARTHRDDTPPQRPRYRRKPALLPAYPRSRRMRCLVTRTA